MKSKFCFVQLLSISAVLLLSSCSHSDNDLSMLVIPVGSVEQTKKTYAPFVSYLQSKTGSNVQLITPSSYLEAKSLVQSSKKFDIVNLNGVLYSQFDLGSTYSVFAQESSDGEVYYNSVFISYRPSSVRTLSDIQGQKLALVNPFSTSGALVPVLMLKKINLLPDKDYNYSFLGSHLSTADAVTSGRFNVGATSWKSLKQLIRASKIKSDMLRIISVSDPIPLDPWLIRNDLDPRKKSLIKSAFYDLSDQQVLKDLGSDGFIPASSNTHEILKQDSQVYERLMPQK